MTNGALILRDDSQLRVAGFAEMAVEIKEQALQKAALIGVIGNVQQQKSAVEAQGALKDVINAIEKARKTVKQPVLDYGRAIDDAAKKFIQELEVEHGRISHLIAERELAERRRVAAEQEAQRKELARLEREKLEALSKEKDLQKQTEIMEDFSRREALESQPIAVERMQGQVVKDDWEIEVVNPYELAKFHPQCVTITAKLGEIKALLAQKITVMGIKATPIIKTHYRKSQPIDV